MSTGTSGKTSSRPGAMPIDAASAAVATTAGLPAAPCAGPAAAASPPYNVLIQLPTTTSRTAKRLHLFAATLREHPKVRQACATARDNARLVEVRATASMGQGAYAREPIRKGTLLAVAGWTLSDAPDGAGAANNSVQCSGHVGASKTCYNLHLVQERDAAGAAGRGEFVSLFHYWNNQCRDANCDFREEHVQTASVRVPYTFILARVDIPAGEQLFIRYNGDGQRQGQVECLCKYCGKNPDRRNWV